jgi:DNA-directed RNA polymerase specialized sigma24 family protein
MGTTDKLPDNPDSVVSQLQRPELRARLINLAARKGIPAADREDIASAVTEEAIRCQAEFDPRCGSFPSWIKGIAKNVICTHLRKQNAQKRKPEGGTISFDAASPGDDDPWGPKDTGKPESGSSEEVEHLIETANLSEKEQKAIALRLDKEGKKSGVNFSSSTDRRAIRKIQQVKNDEEFRESWQGPDALECAYGNIPAAERSAAVLFDQLRRTKWFVDAIGDWRKSAESSDARAFLQKQAALERFPLRILDQHWSEQLRSYRQAAYKRGDLLYRQFEAAVDITLAFPEWPKVAYCQLAPGKRRKRLQEFGWTFGAEPFWEITEPTFEVFAAAPDENQQPIATLAEFLESLNKSPKTGSDAYSSTHLVRFDWRYPLETITASFRRWAEKQPKRQLRPIPQAGRSATTLLVGFAGIRLIDDFGLSLGQAMSWLKERYGGPIPKTPERLERAVRAARDDLKDFLPPPAEIGV